MGHYRYTEDLLALEQAGQARARAHSIGRAASPLHPQAWEAGLASYPDQQFAQFLLRGIRDGFRIGAREHSRCQSSKRNLQSAYKHPQIIRDYLAREEQLGRIHRLSPQELSTLLQLQVNPFGVIPKRHRPNKWRLIVDLSSPHGKSINDAIDRDLCSISYTSIDSAVSFIQALGPGCLLAKLDLREAYRAVPIHPLDRPLLGMQWEGVTYVDGALPFGLRSAPKIFSALADGLMWILHSRGVTSALHYLNDFLLLGPPSSKTCQAALCSTLSTCEELGLPVAPEKTEGPGTVLTFLAIEIDSGLPATPSPGKITGPPSNHPQMDAIWAETSTTTLRQKTRPALANWSPQSCCHGGTAWARLLAQPYRCFCNNYSPGSLGPP